MFIKNNECGLSGKVEFHANRTRKINEMNVLVIDKDETKGIRNVSANVFTRISKCSLYKDFGDKTPNQ